MVQAQEVAGATPRTRTWNLPITNRLRDQLRQRGEASRCGDTTPARSPVSTDKPHAQTSLRSGHRSFRASPAIGGFRGSLDGGESIK